MVIHTMVGITTVLSRRKDLLPRTLASMRAGGFEQMRIFLDGATLAQGIEYEQEFRLPVTVRNPAVRTYGNWCLGLGELYVRNPTADRYLMVQDDFVTYRRLKDYLDRCSFPQRGFWNLYTFPANQKIVREKHGGKVGWFESDQLGKGAVALMFSREGVIDLLQTTHMTRRPLDAQRGWKNIDGGIMWGAKERGYKEFCHNPSLTQHIGVPSSMRNSPQPSAESFRGEDFDATTLPG